MSETIQNIKCGWIGCGQQFGSEIDMNMHVMMNHMCLLEHGNFVLNRGAPRRKRPLEVVREPSPEITEIPPALKMVARVKPEPNPAGASSVPQIPNPVGFTPKGTPCVLQPASSQDQMQFKRLVQNMMTPVGHLMQVPSTSSVPPLQQFSPIPPPPPPTMPIINDEDSEASLQNGDDQAQFDAQDPLNMIVNPTRLSDIIAEFLERLRPMKQLGFIRPQRPVYCIVCLKYVRSFHECNWKHTPGEERIAEMWYRRFQKSRPSGKHQLTRELLEIQELILNEEMEEDAKVLASKN